MSDLSEMFEVITGCCLHDPQWKPEDVQAELAWIGDRQSGSDSSSIVIVKLSSQPQYGLLTQSEDYTGHGCHCDSMVVREDTLRKLLGHLTDYELEDVISR